MPPKYGELQMDAVIESMIETDIDFWVESKQYEPKQLKFSSYKGEKCMACEAGEIDGNDYCDNCGCFASAD